MQLHKTLLESFIQNLGENINGKDMKNRITKQWTEKMHWEKK